MLSRNSSFSPEKSSGDCETSFTAPPFERLILGAVAAGAHGDIPTAMQQMSSFARVHEPQGAVVRGLHHARFAVFEPFQSVACQASRA